MSRLADLPEPISSIVEGACEALVDATDNLRSVVLYGSAARGHLPRDVDQLAASTLVLFERCVATADEA